MRPINKAIIEANIATLMMGSVGVLAKLISLNAFLQIFSRTAIAALVLFLVLLVKKQKIILNSFRDFIAALIPSVLMGAHWVTFFYSIKISSVGIGLISLFTFPVITAIMEPLFFKHKIFFLDILLSSAGLIGVIILVPEWNISNNITQGVFWGIVSAFIFSLRNIYSKKFMLHYSSNQLMFYQVLITSLFLLPAVFFFPPFISAQDFILLLLLGIIFTAGSHTLLLKSLSVLKARTASIIFSLEPLYSITLAYFLIGEKPGARVVLGGTIIIIAIIIETLKQKE